MQKAGVSQPLLAHGLPLGSLHSIALAWKWGSSDEPNLHAAFRRVLQRSGVLAAISGNQAFATLLGDDSIPNRVLQSGDHLCRIDGRQRMLLTKDLDLPDFAQTTVTPSVTPLEQLYATLRAAGRCAVSDTPKASECVTRRQTSVPFAVYEPITWQRARKLLDSYVMTVIHAARQTNSSRVDLPRRRLLPISETSVAFFVVFRMCVQVQDEVIRTSTQEMLTNMHNYFKDVVRTVKAADIQQPSQDKIKEAILYIFKHLENPLNRVWDGNGLSLVQLWTEAYNEGEQ